MFEVVFSNGWLVGGIQTSAGRTSSVLEDSQSEHNPFPVIIIYQCRFYGFLLKAHGEIDNCLCWGFCGRCHHAWTRSFLWGFFFFFSPSGPDRWLQVSSTTGPMKAEKPLHYLMCSLKTVQRVYNMYQTCHSLLNVSQCKSILWGRINLIGRTEFNKTAFLGHLLGARSKKRMG